MGVTIALVAMLTAVVVVVICMYNQRIVAGITFSRHMHI